MLRHNFVQDKYGPWGRRRRVYFRTADGGCVGSRELVNWIDLNVADGESRVRQRCALPLIARKCYSLTRTKESRVRTIVGLMFAGAVVDRWNGLGVEINPFGRLGPPQIENPPTQGTWVRCANASLSPIPVPIPIHYPIIPRERLPYPSPPGRPTLS